jgi:hypothetical protein
VEKSPFSGHRKPRFAADKYCWMVLVLWGKEVLARVDEPVS